MRRPARTRGLSVVVAGAVLLASCRDDADTLPPDPDAYLTAAAEAEGGPPDVPGGPPHLVGGMWAELLVRAS